MSDHLPLTAVILVSSFQENVKYFPVIGCLNDNCAAHKAIAQLSHAGMPIAADVRYCGAKVHEKAVHESGDDAPSQAQ